MLDRLTQQSWSRQGIQNSYATNKDQAFYVASNKVDVDLVNISWNCRSKNITISNEKAKWMWILGSRHGIIILIVKLLLLQKSSGCRYCHHVMESLIKKMRTWPIKTGGVVVDVLFISWNHHFYQWCNYNCHSKSYSRLS